MAIRRGIAGTCGQPGSSNSPSRAATVKAAHSWASKTRTGPPRSLESRTAILPSTKATSTHPFSPLRLLLRQFAPDRSTIIPSPLLKLPFDIDQCLSGLDRVPRQLEQTLERPVVPLGYCQVLPVLPSHDILDIDNVGILVDDVGIVVVTEEREFAIHGGMRAGAEWQQMQGHARQRGGFGQPLQLFAHDLPVTDDPADDRLIEHHHVLRRLRL